MNEKRSWKGDIEEFSKKSKKKKEKITPPRFPLSLWGAQSVQSNRAGKNKESSAWRCEWKGKEGGKQEIMKTSLISTDPPHHCWSHYQFRCWDVLKNAWLCKLSHSLSRRDNRPSHTPRGGVLWGGRGGRREKTKDGCRVTQRPPAELAGGSRGPINSAEQNSKILDAGMEATTASPCCWWPTGDIYRYTYKKNTLPV